VQIGRVKVDILVIFDPLASGGVTLATLLARSAADGGYASRRTVCLISSAGISEGRLNPNL
jgi:hypothetical protein